MTVEPRIDQRLFVLVLIIIAIVIILALRLWTLQIIQHDHFQERADNNLRRVSTTQSVRGRIFDRNGVPLVTNRSTMAVMAPALRIDGYHQFYRLSEGQQEWVNRLAEVLDMTPEDVVARLTTTREGPLDLRLLSTVSMETAAFIAEHSNEFAGVEINALAVREYPEGSLAAHVLGYTGSISDAEMALPAFEGYNPSDIVGKTGIERSFEHILQGVRGTRVLEVNAQGQPQRVIEETEPTAGQDIYLTIDIEVNRAAERALADALRMAWSRGHTDAQAGSAVVMNVNTGEIIAMANVPTFYPEEFIGGISTERWEELTGEDSNLPLINRSISALYPPASTFKSFMTFAMVDKLEWETNRSYLCTGTWTGFGDLWPWRCWVRTGHGWIDMYASNIDSCDVYFYEAAVSFHLRDEEEIQETARAFGYGRRTGIDLPDERRGRVPDAEWKAYWNQDFPEYRNWVPGDTVNLSIGQGDLLSTPLQVAYSYVPIANGGTLWQPQILHSVKDSRGELMREIEPMKSEIQPDFSEESYQIVKDSLRGAVVRGTAQSAFRGFPIPVAGKTGTAEVGVRDPITGYRDQDDHAWFVAYAPAYDPQYVAVVLIEHGGSGGRIAAPAVRQIFAELFGQEVELVTVDDESRYID